MRVAAVVLAAGASQRMGRCKLSLPLHKKYRQAASDIVLDSALRLAKRFGSPALAVLAPQSCVALHTACKANHIPWVIAPDAHTGMAASLKTALAALLKQEATTSQDFFPLDGLLVLLGDQPDIRASTIEQLLAVFAAQPQSAVAASFKHCQANPVILPRRAFSAIQQLQGDVGARNLLPLFDLQTVETDDPGTIADIDTPEAYTAWLHTTLNETLS